MKLDPRIIEGKKPLTFFDLEEAKQFIGKDCYFSDNARDYGDLSNCQVGRLLSASTESEFNATKNNSFAFFKYCLPCEWVNQEPKYRPYALAEWIEQHEIGEVIHYRSKSEGIELRHIYTGYAFNESKDITKPNIGTLTLGVASYSLAYLLEDYEIEINNEWQPFGMEDKE